MERDLTISGLAREGGVGVETVRYYEKKGLLPKPPRTQSGYRKYPPDAARRIRFIRHAKELGFTLREIGELLSLRVSPDTPCSEIKKRARAKIQDIEGKLDSLSRMKSTLERLEKRCQSTGPVAECPILEALDRQ